MAHTSRPRLAALLAVLSCALAACSAEPSAFHPNARVDLETLRQRSRPDVPWEISQFSFRELLTLRDRPDPAAVPVLGHVLDDNVASSKIHRYAAAQALFAVGTDDALSLLDRHTLRPGFDGRLAFDYAFHWDMYPEDRDGFLERCVLRNAGEAPTLRLSGRVQRVGRRQSLHFEVTVRNDLDHALEIMDPASRHGELLVFRAVGGHVANTLCPRCEHTRTRRILLGPGESRNVSIAVETLSPDDTPGSSPAGATIAARAGGYSYLLGAPGAYDVVARWTSNEGRSVSAPVRVEIAPLR